MATHTDSDLIECLTWRYAVKEFDSARKIPASDWATLEQALVLSPSAYGLQPYRFLIIDSPAIRKRLTPASMNQSKVEQCSHFVVFAIRVGLTVTDIDRLVARTAEVRKVSIGSLAKFRETMIGDLIDGPRHTWVDHWSARQAYLALGNLLTCAAALGVDAGPMEGFDPARYDEILGLGSRGLSSVVACALGYRSDHDDYARLAKVRLPVETLIEHY